MTGHMSDGVGVAEQSHYMPTVLFLMCCAESAEVRILGECVFRRVALAVMSRVIVSSLTINTTPVVWRRSIVLQQSEGCDGK